MAFSVFGVPITMETLIALEKYDGKKITRLDLAREALEMKLDDEKHVQVSKYVENLKVGYGDGISVLCEVYNATGDTVNLVATHDWYGHLWKAPYPLEIANGQWGGFMHVKPDWPNWTMSGSAAGVVYRGKNQAVDECDWMLSWHSPWWTGYTCKAYTEVSEAAHFEGDDIWNKLYNQTDNSDIISRAESNGCVSKVSMG